VGNRQRSPHSTRDVCRPCCRVPGGGYQPSIAKDRFGPIQVTGSRRQAARRTRSRSHPDRGRPHDGRLREGLDGSCSMRSRGASSPATAKVILHAPARAAFGSMKSVECSSISQSTSSPTRLSGDRPKNPVYQSMLASGSDTGTPAKRSVIALCIYLLCVSAVAHERPARDTGIIDGKLGWRSDRTVAHRSLERGHCCPRRTALVSPTHGTPAGRAPTAPPASELALAFMGKRHRGAVALASGKRVPELARKAALEQRRLLGVEGQRAARGSLSSGSRRGSQRVRRGSGRASGQSRVVSESMATVIARINGASSPAATSTP
jgi:hypothetical protein